MSTVLVLLTVQISKYYGSILESFKMTAVSVKNTTDKKQFKFKEFVLVNVNFDYKTTQT